MISLDLALISIFILVVLNYRAQRSVLYPPFIFCAMWLLVIVLIRLDLIELDPLHDNTLAILATGAASFSAGGLLAGLVPRGLLRIHFHHFLFKSRITPGSLRNTLMIVLLCGLPVMFYRTWQLSNSQGGGFNILMQARQSLLESIESEDSSQFGVMAYLMAYLLMCSTFVSLLFATEKKDRKFWVVTFVAFIAAILSTGRVSILQLISGLSAIRLLQTKQESLRGAVRLLRWPIVLFVALFIGLVFTNKNTEGMTGGVTGIATFFVLAYIVGPLAAFDKVVQNPAIYKLNLSHTFYFPLHIAAKLHLMDYTNLRLTDYITPPMYNTFVLVPFPINVYTVFKFYFLELGTFGTVVILFVIGLLHSLLYLKARQGGRFSTYLFAYSVYPVLMVIFVDEYSGMGQFPIAFCFGLLYFLIGSVPFRLLPARKNHFLQTGP
jgi:oligosaccharide repeat unit polymerase